MKKIKDFFKKRTLQELLFLIFIVLFFVQNCYLWIIASKVSKISSDFDSIIGTSRSRRNSSSYSWINIDWSVSASVDWNISID